MGKIANSPIEMSLNFKDTEITGSYFYKSQNKPIQLKGKFDGGMGKDALGSFVFEEFVNGEKTGEFSTSSPTGVILVADYPNKINQIKGTWTNAKTGEKLPFEMQKMTNTSENKSQLKNIETEPMLSLECQEGLKTLSNPDLKSTENQIVINVNSDEQIIGYKCNIGGYQSIYNFNYVNKKTNEKKLLNFAYYNPEISTLDNQNQEDVCLRSYDWNIKDKILIIRCSNRGLGDCGSEHKHKWLESAKFFELITAKYQEECILGKPENQNKTDKEQQEIIKNLQFSVVYQK